MSVKNRRARAILEGRHPGKGFPANLIRPARRKLVMIAEARKLRDLRAPPANRLEMLKGDRAGRNSIRINDQFRVRFMWTAGGAEHLEITDYHRGSTR